MPDTVWIFGTRIIDGPELSSRGLGRAGARGVRESVRTPHRSRPAVTNILVGVFAIMLCLVNALVWTFISEMPLMGSAWVGAAALCFWLQKWSKW